ncbi:MAG: Superoxide dismutase [Bacteroidota bacterium]
MKNRFILAILLIGASALYPAYSQFIQAPLPYGYAALEPYIDAQTMEIHFSKHHAAYIKNLNGAIAGTDIATARIEDILANVSKYSEAVRNNAGGHYNHALFWTILTPGKTSIHPQLEAAIKVTWGSVDSMKTLINKAAATRFGSGWAWLYVTPEGKLAIGSSPNQDNPLMDLSPIKGYPILGIDVWEHAYYLKYQNKRGDYLNAIWNVINWEEVSRRFFNVVPEKSQFDVWPALKDFHAAITAISPPIGEGNLQQAKSLSTELFQKASALSDHTVPSEFNKPDVLKAIRRLRADSKKLNDLVVRNSSDDMIRKSLTVLNDTFHQIVDICFGEEK